MPKDSGAVRVAAAMAWHARGTLRRNAAEPILETPMAAAIMFTAWLIDAVPVATAAAWAVRGLIMATSLCSVALAVAVDVRGLPADSVAVPMLATAMAAPNKVTTWLIAAVADAVATADADSGVLSVRLPVADANEVAALVSGTPNDRLADSVAVALTLATSTFPDTMSAVAVAVACADAVNGFARSRLATPILETAIAAPSRFTA